MILWRQRSCCDYQVRENRDPHRVVDTLYQGFFLKKSLYSSYAEQIYHHHHHHHHFHLDINLFCISFHLGAVLEDVTERVRENDYPSVNRTSACDDGNRYDAQE